MSPQNSSCSFPSHGWQRPTPEMTASCARPAAVLPLSQMRRVVDLDERAANVEIVHTDEWAPAAFERPRSLQNASAFCPYIGGADGRGFRFCDALRARPWQTGARRMKMHVILQRCAFFDRGAQWMGGTYDRTSYLVAAHINSVPRFHGRNVRTFDALGMGLAPYSCDAQSHFWVTARYVLTLLDVLPGVPVVVCDSARLSAMWAMLNVDRARLLPFDPKSTYYAQRLYSIVPSPYGPHGRSGGEPYSEQVSKQVSKVGP